MNCPAGKRPDVSIDFRASERRRFAAPRPGDEQPLKGLQRRRESRLRTPHAMGEQAQPSVLARQHFEYAARVAVRPPGAARRPRPGRRGAASSCGFVAERAQRALVVGPVLFDLDPELEIDGLCPACASTSSRAARPMCFRRSPFSPITMRLLTLALDPDHGGNIHAAIRRDLVAPRFRPKYRRAARRSARA